MTQTTNHRSPIRAAAEKIAERLGGFGRSIGPDDVIDLRERAWEYDEVDIHHGPGDEGAIQRLLVNRVGAGWDLDGFEVERDRTHFVFRRSVPTR